MSTVANHSRIAVDSTATLSPKDVARYWTYVKRSGADECWLWVASLRRAGGYGQFGLYRDGRTQVIQAHRIAWAIHRGPVPDGLMVCHQCDCRACVNPQHLFLGTATDNAIDMSWKGRASRQASPVFLESATIKALRQRYLDGDTMSSLAKDFCLHPRDVKFYTRGVRPSGSRARLLSKRTIGHSKAREYARDEADALLRLATVAVFDRLDTARIEQTYLAQQIGVSRQTISLARTRGINTLTLLAGLAKAAGCRVSVTLVPND